MKNKTRPIIKLPLPAPQKDFSIPLGSQDNEGFAYAIEESGIRGYLTITYYNEDMLPFLEQVRSNGNDLYKNITINPSTGEQTGVEVFMKHGVMLTKKPFGKEIFSKMPKSTN